MESRFHDPYAESAPGVQMYLCISLTCRRLSSSVPTWWKVLTTRGILDGNQWAQIDALSGTVFRLVHGERMDLWIPSCSLNECWAPGLCEACSTHMAASSFVKTNQIITPVLSYLSPLFPIDMVFHWQMENPTTMMLFWGAFPGLWRGKDNGDVCASTNTSSQESEVLKDVSPVCHGSLYFIIMTSEWKVTNDNFTSSCFPHHGAENAALSANSDW